MTRSLTRVTYTEALTDGVLPCIAKMKHLPTPEEHVDQQIGLAVAWVEAIVAQLYKWETKLPEPPPQRAGDDPRSYLEMFERKLLGS